MFIVSFRRFRGWRSSGDVHTAYIGIGSNLGERSDVCRRAVTALCAGDRTILDRRSPLYETEPVGMESQGWFVNSVVRVLTEVSASALHRKLQRIEYAFGRQNGGPRFGPRVLDLDLLFYDDLVVKTDDLEIPHPRLHERRFVLQPLCDIAPELMHPVMKETASRLLSRLRDGKRVVLLE